MICGYQNSYIWLIYFRNIVKYASLYKRRKQTSSGPSFSRKLQYWSSQVDYHNIDYLKTLAKYQLESEFGLPAETVGDIKDHLKSLSISLNEYFPYLEI